MIKAISAGLLALSQRSPLVNTNKNLRGRDLNATTNQTTLPTPTENSISNMQLREQVPVATRQLNDPTAVALPVVGEIVAFPYDSIPGGFLVCDGREVSRADYPELFDKLLVSYGPGDSVSTFHLPDLRGQFIRGLDLGSGTDPNAASRTNRGDGTAGNTVGTKQSDAFQGHYHEVGSIERSDTDDGFTNLHFSFGSPTRGIGTVNADTVAQTPMTDGSNGRPRTAVETRPTNIAMIYAIRAKVTDLSEQFVTINSMATLNSDLTTLDTSLTTLTSDVSALSTAHNSLDTEVSTLDTSLTTLTSDVSALSTAHNSLDTSVKTLDSDVDVMNSTITKNIHGLNTEVDELTNQLTSVLTELNELKKKLQ